MTLSSTRSCSPRQRSLGFGLATRRSPLVTLRQPHRLTFGGVSSMDAVHSMYCSSSLPIVWGSSTQDFLRDARTDVERSTATTMPLSHHGAPEPTVTHHM